MLSCPTKFWINILSFIHLKVQIGVLMVHVIRLLVARVLYWRTSCVFADHFSPILILIVDLLLSLYFVIVLLLERTNRVNLFCCTMFLI